jgi:transcriptional regulator with XRE-family HTH domain
LFSHNLSSSLALLARFDLFSVPWSFSIASNVYAFCIFVNMQKAFLKKMQFGDRFRALLKQRGLTQVEASRLLEMDQSTISRYCNVERSPRPHVLRHMADNLGVSIAELRGEKDALHIKGRGSSKRRIEIIPPPDESVSRALGELKKRWKRKPYERDTIRHLIAALFPGNHDKVITWLEQT